jgi:hypothetical protein
MNPPSLSGSATRFVSVSTPPVPSLVWSPSVPSVLISPPQSCNILAHAQLSVPPRRAYLSWIGSGIDQPGNMDLVDFEVDVDEDWLLSLHPNTWARIRAFFSSPAPVVIDAASLPLLSHVPVGNNLVFLMFGVAQDYTFRVPLDFPIEYTEMGPSGMKSKLHGQDALRIDSNHANHRRSPKITVTFMRV